MKYSYKDKNLAIEPQEFNKDESKEILQYAVGGLLYMPASNLKVANKIINGTFEFVKSLVLDLEDALGDDLVGFGKRTIQSVVEKLDEAIQQGKFEYTNIPLIFVRVRDFGQMEEIEGLLGNNIKYITGFNIPKFDKYNCDKYIKEFTKVNKKVQERFDGKYKLYIMPIIENKNAMYRQLRMDNLLYINNALRSIQDNVLNIRVGGADFCSIYGIRRSIHDDIYDIGVVRSVFNDIINVFGKNYIVSGPVWEYFENKEDTGNNKWKTGLIKELYADRLNGFLGKTCIHPSQLPVVQESLIVTKADYDDAINIISMNSNTTGVQKSVGNSRMNEVKTHMNWARKIIALARLYGVEENQ